MRGAKGGGPKSLRMTQGLGEAGSAGFLHAVKEGKGLPGVAGVVTRVRIECQEEARTAGAQARAHCRDIAAE